MARTDALFMLDSPLDMHLHFREGDLLRLVAPLSAQTFSGGVIMPNLVPPVDNDSRLDAYRTAILAAINGEVFEPYMTLFMRPYTEEELARSQHQIIGIKLYPEGVTTHSDRGVKQLSDIASTLECMQEMGIPLLVHGETKGFVMDREREFLTTYEEMTKKYPRLTIVMEHITTKESVTFLDRFERLYATVTLQHLLITLDDVAGGLLNPHLFCKPIAKRPEDRDALLEASLTAHPKLMFGSDSAPHPKSKKECNGCAAGVFTAPVALQMLVELFEQHRALDKLQAFVSDNAKHIYGVKPPEKTVTFEKSGDVIPNNYGEVIPIWAGKPLAWKVRDVTS